MLHVVVGVIINEAHQILVAQRPSHVDHGGLWEFPGGKVETNETVYHALCRELKEELDLNIISAAPLIKVKHHYDEYSVLLDTWMIREFRGEAKGAEGQVVRWVNFSELQQLKMPEASQYIIPAFSSRL